jgi:hypothetical protein
MDKMNFKSGLAGDFTLGILQHLVKKESVCENLHQRYEEGGSLARENAGGVATYQGGSFQSSTYCFGWRSPHINRSQGTRKD